MKKGPKPKLLRERFDSKWIIEPFSGCWLWLGCVNNGGYGQIYDGVSRLAHRVSWELYRGAIPEGLDVLHRCDVTRCVNHAHLFLGTAVENALDSIAKGRWGLRRTIGERHGMAKLTDANVLGIRASTEPLAVLSKRFGVSMATISYARRGNTWKHLYER